MMSIPGLLRVPIAETSNPDDVIEFTSFSMKKYSVPASHRYGKCRPLSDFEKISVIGEGSYGTVYKVKDKLNNTIVAGKKLKIAKESQLMPQNLQREITNLKLLKHENIVNLIDVAVGESFESTCLILEYCKYSLDNVLYDDANCLEQPHIKNIMHQLFSGLDFIHKHCIFHRDLNPSNILFNEEGILKITDFNSSRKTTKGNVTPNVGTRWYKAPEILFGSVSYSSSVDIWSAACIFGELILKKVLFPGENDLEMIHLINHLLGPPTEKEWPEHTKLPFFEHCKLSKNSFNRIRATFCSEFTTTVSLIQEMLVYNPSMRLSAENCLKHRYFSILPEPCSLVDLLCALQASEAI